MTEGVGERARDCVSICTSRSVTGSRSVSKEVATAAHGIIFFSDVHITSLYQCATETDLHQLATLLAAPC